jgi:hypothetical protein
MYASMYVLISDPFFSMENDDDDGGRQRRLSTRSNSVVSAFSALRIQCGACTRRGPREKQEDRFVAIHDLSEAIVEANMQNLLPDDVSISYFAVYDGHSGAEASSHLEKQLHLDVYRCIYKCLNACTMFHVVY